MQWNDIIESVKPFIKDFIIDALVDVGDDIEAYGAAVAEDFVRCATAVHEGDDDDAEQNIRHLKVQLRQLAIMHRIKITQELHALIETCLITALKIVLTAALA